MKYLNRISISLALFVFSFIIYFITTAPDVTFTDSGELAGVCSTFGIAHPTGYPLFAILGNLWTLLPLSNSPVYSMNLFAGFATACSVAVFFNIVYIVINYLAHKQHKRKTVAKDLKKKQKVSTEHVESSKLNEKQILLISVVTALLYAFADTVWAQATSIEVYSLQLLMINLIVYFLILSFTSAEKYRKYTLLAALFLGLGFSNHMTTILLLPGIIFIFFKNPDKKFDFSGTKFKELFILLIPFFLGLSLYLYLPFRSSAEPTFNWGWVSRGFDKFYYHISGKQYQTWMFSGENIGVNISKFFNLIPWQLAWLGIIPLFAGFYRTYKSCKEIFWFLLISQVACFVYSINYPIHDIDSYFLTAFFSMLILTGVGFYHLIETYQRKIKTGIAIALLSLLPLFSLFANFSSNDESGNYLVSEYMHNVVDNLPKNSIIISSQWDFWVSAFWYKQQIEGLRADIVLVEKELLRRTWYLRQFQNWYPEVAKKSETQIKEFLEDLELFESGKQYDGERIQRRFLNLLRSFVDNNISDRKLYVSRELLFNQGDAVFFKDMAQVPDGFLVRLEKENKPYQVSVDNLKLEKFIGSIGKKTDHLTTGIVLNASDNFSIIGNYALMISGQKDIARKAYETALKLNPKNEQALQGLVRINNTH